MTRRRPRQLHPRVIDMLIVLDAVAVVISNAWSEEFELTKTDSAGTRLTLPAISSQQGNCPSAFR